MIWIQEQKRDKYHDRIKTLVDRSGLFHYTKLHYFLFSKTGFTKDVKEYVENTPNIKLISFNDICNL